MQETRRAETGQLRRRIESIPGIAQPAAGNDRDVSLMADYPVAAVATMNPPRYGVNSSVSTSRTPRY